MSIVYIIITVDLILKTTELVFGSNYVWCSF